MPVEEFPKCTVQRGHGLINKILETLSRFTKRINIHHFLLSEFKSTKKSFIDTDLTRSKSHDNLDFMRYIDDISGRRPNRQDNNLSNANKWEILSQINHTPQMSLKTGMSDQSLTDNKHLGRHKSMNDLLAGTKSSKQVDKLNTLLDFVMGQMLDSPYKDSDKLLKSIQDLVVESGVQIILQSICELNDSFAIKTPTWNPNYLRVVCSPGNSSSESETLSKPTWLPTETNPQPQNNNLSIHIRENNQNHKIKNPKQSSVVCIPNAHIDKGIKHRLNMKNIMSPSFQESIAFKYSSKARKYTKKQSKMQSMTKDSRSVAITDRRGNGEYSCYITAKKASNPPCNKIRNNLNWSVINSKSSLESNHASNLSPIQEDNNIEHGSNSQSSNRVILSKSIIQPPVANQSVTKSKKTMPMPFPNRKSFKSENTEKDKLVKGELNSVYEILGKSPFTPRQCQEKLQIIKASSVECISGEPPETTDTKFNVAVLSIKYGDSKPMEKNMKITPINFVFAGESFNNKSLVTESPRTTDSIPLKKLKSVVSNMKYFQDDLKQSRLNPQIFEATSLKSKTTFGIDSGYTSNGRQKLQISNYFITKNHETIENLERIANDQPETPEIDLRNKNIKSISDWTEYIRNLESENNLLSSKGIPNSLNLSTTIAMVNNNNDRVDLEISENDQLNTDSSCTFHAVRAKYFKEYLPTNGDSESTTNENLLSNDASRYVSLDPNPEEIKNIYEKVRDKSNVQQISIGRTYSCDENNDLPVFNNSSAANSHSFVTRYNTSTEDESEPHNQKPIIKDHQINSLEWLNENQFQLANKPQMKEVHRKTTKNYDFTLTSVVDVIPVSNANNLTVVQCSDLDNNSENHEPSINVVYCRHPGDRKSTKRYQKNIPENLLKHTFASQQKVRLKHE